MLTDLLGARVRLVRGASSRRKVFEVELGTSELGVRLRQVFGDHGPAG